VRRLPLSTGSPATSGLGTRYDFVPTTLLKAEYHRARSGNGSRANEVAIQVAVGF